MGAPFTDSYDRAFLLDTMIGPNAMRITEEMAGFPGRLHLIIII